ncbi:hypothetical protein DR864_02805 [Runella rosea]|uniref:DNA mimic protein DMP19 C-terminal domain-containing protein n=1 Tax=Runella rosea TaxID=2259595 RepID=A0A344TDL3_9BACT|nr:hypothetical protein [Runella rosea]AXE16734.1 hypothetical protein DR864_02805 [Runella rosea]
MKISIDNTQNLTSFDFIEMLSTELWDDDNIYLIDDPKKEDIPDYFYITAYLLQFDTELQMSGLTTLLTNSSTYNFENTLNSFKKIGSIKLANCLQDILDTLNKFGMTPAKMRDRFLKGSEDFSEYSIITTGQFFKENDLLEELKIHEDELFNIYSQIWIDLESYLINIRGK